MHAEPMPPDDRPFAARPRCQAEIDRQGPRCPDVAAVRIVVAYGKLDLCTAHARELRDDLGRSIDPPAADDSSS